MHPLKKEFIELYKKSGWSQAEAARQLELTRGGVNGLITGQTVPSLATVKLFQLILNSPSDKRPKPSSVTRAGEEWAEPLLEELRKLEEEPRARLVAALREVIRVAADKPGKSKRSG